MMRLFAGALAPDAGEIRLGASLEMGYFAQQALQILNPDLTIEEQMQRDFPNESIDGPHQDGGHWWKFWGKS